LPGAGDSLPGAGGTHEADSSRHPDTSSQGLP
jgi:serine/threonine-protein kinase